MKMRSRLLYLMLSCKLKNQAVLEFSPQNLCKITKPGMILMSAFLSQKYNIGNNPNLECDNDKRIRSLDYNKIFEIFVKVSQHFSSISKVLVIVTVYVRVQTTTMGTKHFVI